MRLALPVWTSTDPSSPDFGLVIADLPHGLEEAQHILDLEQLRWLLWVVVALTLFFLAYRLLRKLTRRPSAAVPPPKPDQKPAPVPMPEVAQSIFALRDRHLKAKTFRQGCHELAELLRGFYETVWREPMTTRTVREIQIVEQRKVQSDDGGAPGRLFGLLEDLQFSRRAPTADDLESVCDLAATVTSVLDETQGAAS